MDLGKVSSLFEFDWLNLLMNYAIPKTQPYESDYNTDSQQLLAGHIQCHERY